MESLVVSLAKQLAVRAPLLLVYPAGMVLAVVLWRRAPSAALLCLLGLGLLLVGSVVQPFVNLYLIQSMSTQGWTSDRLATLLSVSGIIGSILRAVATGLLIAAVFAGRRAAPAGRPGVGTTDEPLRVRPAGTGITRPQGGESFSTGG